MAALDMPAQPHRDRGSKFRRYWALLVGCALVGQTAACSFPIVDMYDAQAVAATESKPHYDDSEWTLTLRENVKAGLVDYQHLAEHPESLRAYGELIRAVGPQSTPGQFNEPGADLAYYLNVYNACVLRAVLRAGVPVSMYDPLLPNLETGYRFWIDGAPRTLHEIHQRANLAARENARIEFALSRAAKGMPALPREPFRAFDVFDRLQALGEEATSDENLVRIDHANAALLVAPPIWNRRGAFEATYCRETTSDSATMLNCLMHFADAEARENLVRATGYTVRPLPFDRALNRWRPRPKR